MPATIEPFELTVYAGVAEPWPGPQPYDIHRRDVFCGRDAEVGRLMGLLSAHRLMLLLAKSGVGKTSLLQAGILPELLEDRRETGGRAPLPLLVRDWWEGSPPPRDIRTAFRNAVWKTLHDAARPNGLLAAPDSERIRQALRESVGDDLLAFPGDGVDLLLAASKAAGSLVVIIDQFEELLRVPRNVGEEDAVGIVRRLFQASEGGSSAISIMLSLRQEFESELRALESVPSVGGLRQRSFFLNTLKASGLREAIKKPATAVGWRFTEDTEDKKVPDGLLNALLSWMEMPGPWLGSERDDHAVRSDWGEPLGGARLLGLQALLKRLYDDLGDQSASAEPLVVDIPDVHRVLELPDHEMRVERWVERALEMHVAHAFDVWSPVFSDLGGYGSAEVAPSEAKALGRRAAALMAPHLYNEAGHKIPRRRGYLNLAARDEHEGEDAVPEESVALSGIARTLGWRGGVLCEALDRITEMVLKHLSSNSINLLKSYGGDAAYELVHDGLGRPFVRWAEGERRKMEFSLSAPYGLRGASFRWQPQEGVYRHLSWHGCEFIGQHFVDVEFAECDLAGCFFVGCSFTGTRFTRQTNLNGAVFRDCRFATGDGGSLLDHVEARSVLFDGGVLEGVAVRRSVLEGATFRGCELVGRVVIEESHVLLAQFGNLRGEGVIALADCDVGYCRIEPERQADDPSHVKLERRRTTCALLNRGELEWQDEPSWRYATAWRNDDGDKPDDASPTTISPESGAR